MGELLYVVPASERTPQGLRALLSAQQQIRFVSLSGVDLGGNDTDERIPVSHFLEQRGGVPRRAGSRPTARASCCPASRR